MSPEYAHNCTVFTYSHDLKLVLRKCLLSVTTCARQQKQQTPKYLNFFLLSHNLKIVPDHIIIIM